MSAPAPAHDLLPCPFCGTVPAAAIEVDVTMWAVPCGTCQAIGPIARNEAGAIAAWNRRPAAGERMP